MSKKKTKQTNTYAFMSRPDTAAETRFQDAIGTTSFIDPALQFGAARAKQNVDEQIDSFNSADYSPEVAGAKRYANKNEIDQNYQNILASAGQQAGVNRLSFLGSAANQNKPQFAQTGGTTEQSGGLIAQLLSSGLGAAGSAIA